MSLESGEVTRYLVVWLEALPGGRPTGRSGARSAKSSIRGRS